MNLEPEEKKPLNTAAVACSAIVVVVGFSAFLVFMFSFWNL